jgi:hypothetical protein
MKIDNKHTDESVPQSVTEFIKLRTGQESIQIGFTDQKVSGYGGLSAFAGFLHWHRLPQRLAEWMGPGPKSGRAIPYADVAPGFCTAILAGAEKLAQVAYLRRDVLLPSLLAIKPVGGQSTLTRYFQHFQGAAQNLRTFRPMWRWCQDRLATRPGGYTLDLDSTQLLHEEGHQEGVRTGHTPRGLKRGLHPLLAVIAEAKLVAGFWLRAGSENVIKDLDEYFAIPKLCLKKCWSTEAALSLAVLSCNLCVLFQRHVGWQERVRAGTLRFRLFTTGGILSKTGGVTTVRLSVPESERAWWRALLEKIVSPFPNCNSVSLWPG